MLGSEGKGEVEVGPQLRVEAKETLSRPEKTDVGCLLGREPGVRGQGFWWLAQPWELEKEYQELGSPLSFSRKRQKFLKTSQR